MPGPPIDDAELDAAGRADPQSRTGVRSGGDQAIALLATFATARSSKRGIDVDARQVLRDVDVDRTAVIGQAGERLRHHLVKPDPPAHERERPGLDPTHVEEVADQAVEPVRLLLDRREELGDLVVVSTRTSSCRRLLTAALIDASGVRRSCETAARIAARRSLTSASLGGVRDLAPRGPGRGPRPRAARRTP